MDTTAISNDFRLLEMWTLAGGSVRRQSVRLSKNVILREIAFLALPAVTGCSRLSCSPGDALRASVAPTIGAVRTVSADRVPQIVGGVADMHRVPVANPKCPIVQFFAEREPRAID
nr:hypothetical protein [Mesorhizobium sp. AR07]